jgi:hypothetical protein
VGVIGAPAGEDDFFEVSFVVAIGVLQKEGVWGLVEEDAAVGEDEGGGDVELVGEDGDFVAFAVAVGVFEDF